MSDSKTKERIFVYVKENAGTYVNQIVDELKMSKTTVSRDVRELLEEKQIISLRDSHNPNSRKIKRVKNSRVVQLVYYDQERDETFHKKSKKEVIPVLPKPKKNDEITRYFDNVKIRLKEYGKHIKELKKKYDESSESEKANLNESITDEMIEEQIDLHATISLARKQLDGRIKIGKFQKIMMAYYMKNESTIRGMATHSGYSSKYCSRLSHNILSEIGLGNLGEFNFNKTDSAFPKLREILGQCPHCNVWTVDALCE